MLTLSLAALTLAPALAGGLEDQGASPRVLTSQDDESSPEFDPGSEPLAIINGEDAARDDYPMTGATIMQATLDSAWGSGEFRMLGCTSTLIAPDVVLLAAHCVDEDAYTYGSGDLSGVDIRWTRDVDLTDHDGSRMAPWPDDAVPAWDWVVPDEWSLFELQVGIATNYDIALLFLDEAVTDVPHAYLVSADEATQLEVGLEVAVVGWGQQTATGFGQQPPPGTYGVKQQGMSHINELGGAEFQVGSEEADVRKCHGDSGGPSFAWLDVETPETMRLVGVTSHAYDQSDCESTGGVDTRVDFYLDWIDAEMRQRCEDGTRAWCEVEGIVPAPMPVEEPEDVEEEKSGLFGCSSAPVPDAGLMLLGLAVLGLRRRRSW